MGFYMKYLLHDVSHNSCHRTHLHRTALTFEPLLRKDNSCKVTTKGTTLGTRGRPSPPHPIDFSGPHTFVEDGGTVYSRFVDLQKRKKERKREGGRKKERRTSTQNVRSDVRAFSTRNMDKTHKQIRMHPRTHILNAP